MKGELNIAVAEFGQIGADGVARSSDFGATLSQSVYDKLAMLYKDEFPELTQGKEGSVWIWHDSLGRIKNVHFGVMKGKNEGERAASAARLAERIGADMVIYGNVMDDGQRDQLQMEFYYRSDKLRSELDLISGLYAFATISIAGSFQADPTLAKRQINPPLANRTIAMFWLTVGLTYDVLGDPAKALQYFAVAVKEAAQEEGAINNALLYFLLGRSALFLHQDDAAEAYFQQALADDPHHVRSLLGLGTTYLQRARGLSHVERRQPPFYLQKAIETHQQALALAQAAHDPFMVALARLALAKSYRLQGSTAGQLAEYDDARRAFAATQSELDQALAYLLTTKQVRLIAQAYEARGAAYYQQAQVSSNQADVQASKAEYEAAQTAYALCIAQGEKAPEDQLLQSQIIEQSCRVNYTKAAEQLGRLEGEAK